MTTEEILKRLNELCPERITGTIFYFQYKLFKRDPKVYNRRSFNDLFLYFKKYGVTELQLMKALTSPESKFAGYICYDIRKVVFLKIPREYKFTSENLNNFINHENKYVVDKYDFKYLEKLYDKCWSNKEENTNS